MASRETPRLYGAAIPLTKSVTLDPEHLRAQLRAVASAAGAPTRVLDSGAPAKRGILSSLRGKESAISIEMAGIGLTITASSRPLCDAKAMHAFINPALWKAGTGEVTGHKAHILISETDATAGADSTDAMFDRATAVTLAAAAVADMPGAHGVIWLPARNALPVGTFGSEMERFMDGQAPLLFWVRSQTLPPPAQAPFDQGSGEEMEPGFATVGLTAFMGAEIIAPPSYCDRDVALDYAFGLASAVIDENRRLKDGAVMGDGRDRMRLVMRQGSAYSQKPHWELESLYKPKPRPVHQAPARAPVAPPPQMPAPQAQPAQPVQPPQAQPPQLPPSQMPPSQMPPQQLPSAASAPRKRPSTWRRSASEPAASPAQLPQPPQPPVAHQPPQMPDPHAPPPLPPGLGGLGDGLGSSLASGSRALPSAGGALVDPDEVLKAIQSGDPLDALPAALRPSAPYPGQPPAPGQYPGQFPGQHPGQYPGHGAAPQPGQHPGQHPGMTPPPEADDAAMRAAMTHGGPPPATEADPLDALPAALRPTPQQQAAQQTPQQPGPQDPPRPEPAAEPERKTAKARRRPPADPADDFASTDIPRPTADERFDEEPPEAEPQPEAEAPPDSPPEDDEGGTGFFDKHLRLVGRS